MDLSHLIIETKGQTPAHPIDSKSTDQLFGGDSNPDPQGDEEILQADKEKSVDDGTRQLEGDQTVKKKDEEIPTIQQ